MFDRATRLWRMSPQIATSRPASFPLCARMVEQSSSACVGCSCAPSPAFTTPARSWRASISAAPACEWRMTTTSGDIASRLRAVSSSVSPLVVDDAEPEMFTASADSRFAAISNDVRVRVDGSRNRLMTVFPRRVGTFLIGRSAISRNRSLRSRRVTRSPRRQRLDAEQVTVSEGAHAGRSRSTTRSGSPRSDNMTRTDSRAVVCTARPTKSGWIGSSRSPRSISAASFTARGRP